MKKKIGIIVTCILVIFAVVMGLGIWAIGSSRPEGDPNCRFYYTSDLTIKDGVMTLDEEDGPAVWVIPFSVGYDVSYKLHVKWEVEPDPGFVTALIIRNADGKILNYVTGDTVDSYLTMEDIIPGDYTAEYTYFNQAGEFRAFLTALGASTDDVEEGPVKGFAGFNVDGSWTIHHSFELEEHNMSYQMGYLIGITAGAVIGIAVVVVLLLVSKKGSSMKSQYDERQELIRGKGFKYAFFTLLVYYGVVTIINVGELPLPIMPEVLNTFGILLGILVFVCYSIWNDAYFSLNEKRGVLTGFFAIVGAVDIFMGISNIKEGVIRGGKLTFDIMPLAAGIIFFILLAVIQIKSLLDREDE